VIIREVTNIAVVGMFSVDLCITFTDSIGRSMFSMQRPVSFYKERPGIFLFFFDNKRPGIWFVPGFCRGWLRLFMREMTGA